MAAYQTGPTDTDPELDDNAPAPVEPDSGTVTLDKSNPDIADAFSNCKVGDTYTITADDDSSITLEKQDAEEEVEPSGDEPKGAVAILMAKKSKK